MDLIAPHSVFFLSNASCGWAGELLHTTRHVHVSDELREMYP